MTESKEFMLSHWAETMPDREAVYDGRIRMNYARLYERVRQLICFLTGKGIYSKDRVLSCLPNCCEAVVLSFAAAEKGFVLVPVNYLSKERDLRHVVDRTEPQIAFVSECQTADILHRINPFIEIITLDIDGSEDALAFLSDCSSTIVQKSKLNDPVLIVCTSGSTGVPKGVLLSGENLIYPASDLIERFRITRDDVVYVPSPLCHMLGFMGMLVTIQAGAKLRLVRKFHADIALKILEEERISVQFCVPTMYEREIIQYEKCVSKPDLSDLRTGLIAGAPSIRHCIEWFDKTVNCRLLNSYGMTEISALTAVDFEDSEEARYSSCGKACTHAQTAVLRKDGTYALPNETGEIVCKGPGLMLGYYGHSLDNEEHMTAAGWFRTGDIGKCDEDGVYTITGRIKDIIIRGGYNVVPLDVEQIYYESGFASEVCVVGYSDQELGERIALFMVLKSGCMLSADELREYGTKNLAKFKVPDKVILLEKLPKLDNGKIDKKYLKNLAVFPK